MRFDGQCPRPPGPLEFGACYVYAPYAAGGAARRSRQVRVHVKAADGDWLPRFAARVRDEYRTGGHFRELFGGGAVLVPVPCCERRPQSSEWAAAQLATALQQVGLARTVWVGLSRRHDVRKSATAPKGERPSVWQHYESLQVASATGDHTNLVLVDDIVTKGRTLLAAAMRLREAFPEADVRAFALVRTLGLATQLQRLVEPCHGAIRWAGEDARRHP